jgi:transcriptional regulator with XRE-family HTH domain
MSIALSIPIDSGNVDEYAHGMDIEKIVRERISEARDKDTKGRGGNPRSWRQIAADAETDYNHLSKFVRGETWMDVRKLAPVCSALGVDVSWLFGGNLQTKDARPKVPVIRSGRFPVDAQPDKLMQEIAVLSLDESPNLSNDPMARWIRLDEDFGEYRIGGQVLITPSFPAKIGDEVAAVVDRRLELGRLQSAAGVQVLVVGNRIYAGAEFRVVAPFVIYFKATAQK